jgi:hypothetical protein
MRNDLGLYKPPRGQVVASRRAAARTVALQCAAERDRVAGARLDLVYEVRRPERLSFADAAVDALLSAEVLEHVPPVDDVAQV